MFSAALRLLWLSLSDHFQLRLAFPEALERSMRVMPGHLDINDHLNHGRCLTLVDLVIVEHLLRSGVLIKAWHLGWRPMVGASMNTFRRGLKPFARDTLRFQLQSWDERWNDFSFECVHAGKSAAAGCGKGATVGRKGWIENADGDQRPGIERPAASHSPALQH